MARRHTLEELFLQLGLCDFNLDSLVDLLVVATLVVGIVLDGGRKEGVDKGSLAQAGFTSNLILMSFCRNALRRKNKPLW
jgi:hypothetical protein